MSETPFPPLIALIGPTGVGKTALAIALAQALDGEIVGADSRQIYRHMEIGTAKPTLAERRAVPHHLVDIIAPDDDFSLAAYQELATAALADITARGKIPLLVGGTGQYLQAVLEGWQVPRVAPDPALRAALEAEAALVGLPVLFARLQAIDPVAATIIAPTNMRRIIRALEVHALTGIPITAQQGKAPPPYRMLTLWLDLPRDLLYRRLDERVDGMLVAGLVDEVRALLARGYDWALPAMSSLGYREWQPLWTGEATLAACTERLKFNTHNFVRKQISWFRRLADVQPLVADETALPQALALIKQLGV